MFRPSLEERVGAPHQCSRADSRLLRGGFDRTCSAPWVSPEATVNATTNLVLQEAGSADVRVQRSTLLDATSAAAVSWHWSTVAAMTATRWTSCTALAPGDPLLRSPMVVLFVLRVLLHVPLRPRLLPVLLLPVPLQMLWRCNWERWHLCNVSVKETGRVTGQL